VDELQSKLHRLGGDERFDSESQAADPDTQLRDTIVILGGDGNYYMTGSSGADIWDFNDGIELWRSADLKKWDYVGEVWSFEQGRQLGKKLALASPCGARDLGAGNPLHQAVE